MHEAVLRTVLLIRAIDQGDRSGDVLSLAERAEATRSAADASSMITPAELAKPELSTSAERLLVRRAELLSSKLEARAPAIVQSVRLADGAWWLSFVLLLGALVFGLGMAALDGQQHIEILAFPLLTLIVWNLVVYVALVLHALRPRREQPTRVSWLSRLYERLLRSRSEGLLRRSARFHAPLADVLKHYAADWAVVARPL
ncbi:MAG: hypothetical protein ABW321_06725, partial [Polyangiales bacterium]